MINIENLIRKYGDFVAVDGVSFEIPRGEIVGLLGHNGAGKTTIMKILTGYLEATAGSVTVNGLDINENLLEVQQSIGYLPENAPLYQDLTVLDYLEFVADLKGVSESGRQTAITKAVEKTSLQAKATDKIETLSKGYKQRVGVAQAILGDPEILILDEPTNGLDPVQIQEMRNLILELAESATVIISTHIMQEVEAICERVLILERGKLALDSTLDEIKSTGGVVLSVDKPESEVKSFFNKVSWVKSYQLLNDQDGIYSYLLTPTEDSGNRFLPELASLVINKGWSLYALAPREQSLESVFRSVSAA